MGALKSRVSSSSEIFSEELTLQVCLIWMQSTVWYFKWWFQSYLKHTTEFTQWNVCRASLWNTHSVICIIYAGYFPVTPTHTLWDVWPLMHPSCGHIHCALQFSESFKAHRKKGGGVCIWLYLCGYVFVCVCIIVYVWAFVYVYMVLFVWVGLCMYV